MKIKPKAVLLDGSQNYTQWSRRVTFILTSQKIASIALATTILPAFLSKTSSFRFSHLPQLCASLHFISCCWQIRWGSTLATTSTFSTSLPTKAHFRGRILCWEVQFSQVGDKVQGGTKWGTWLNCTFQHKMRPRKWALVVGGWKVEKIGKVEKVVAQHTWDHKTGSLRIRLWWHNCKN